MAPCTWPLSYASCGSCTALESMDADTRAAVEAMAVEYLWNWTLKAFGECVVSARPADAECCVPGTYYGWGPYPRGSSTGGLPYPSPALVAGNWVELSCGSCGSFCACGDSLRVLRLRGPVSGVQSVTQDGVELDPSTYRLDRGSLLVRLDGQPWPRRQDLFLPSTEVGTFEVVYTQGRPVPIGGQIAAGLLACELAKALCRDNSCALPARVQTITRQGVTMAMIDNGDGLQKGQTGVFLIDSWVSSVVNPPRPSSVMSPDFRQGARFPVRRVVTPAVPPVPSSLMPQTLPFVIGT